jgi:outer membrane lipoprotein-sorting protein
MKITTILAVCALLSLTAVGRAETLEEILEKNTEALGGRAALENIRSLVKEGKLKVTSARPDGLVVEGTARAAYRAPDKAFMTATVGTRTQMMATDGKVYWESDTSTPGGPQVVTGARAEQRLEDARIDNTYFANYGKLGIKMELLGTEKVGDREAFVIKKTRVYGQQTKAFIDKETGLILKEETSESQMWPSDWRKVDGVLVPFRLKLVYSTETVELMFNEVTINADVPDSMFELPAK